MTTYGDASAWPIPSSGGKGGGLAGGKGGGPSAQQLQQGQPALGENRQDWAAKNYVPGSWDPNDKMNAIRDDFIVRDETGRPLTQAEIDQRQKAFGSPFGRSPPDMFGGFGTGRADTPRAGMDSLIGNTGKLPAGLQQMLGNPSAQQLQQQGGQGVVPGPAPQPAGQTYQEQFGNPNGYAAAGGMPASPYGQEKAWAGDMRNTMGGAPPPGFDEGRAGETWDSMKAKYADPYTAYYGSSGPTNVPGSGGWEPGTEGLPRGPNGNVDWSAVSGDGTGERRNDDSSQPGWASPADFSADATRMEESTYGRMKNLLDPVFNEQQRGLENRLAVQGLPTGGEAYSRAYDVFNRGRSNAYENAALSAIGSGRQEQGRMFDQQMNYSRLASALMGQDAALQNQARQTGLQEALLERRMPQDELAMLFGNIPTTPYPQFQSAGGFGMQSPDIMGAMNSQNNQQNASQNATTSGLMGLFGTALGAGLMPGGFLMSSREWKDPVGDVDTGDAVKAVQSLPIERWRYKGETAEHIGTYAEDFQRAAGVGDGKMIAVVDALGLVMAAIQGIADRLDRLESRDG